MSETAPVVFEPDPMDVYKPSGSMDPEPEKPAVHTADWVASNGVLYCPICGLPAPCPSAPKVTVEDEPVEDEPVEALDSDGGQPSEPVAPPEAE